MISVASFKSPSLPYNVQFGIMVSFRAELTMGMIKGTLWLTSQGREVEMCLLSSSTSSSSSSSKDGCICLRGCNAELETSKRWSTDQTNGRIPHSFPPVIFQKILMKGF